MLKRYKYPRAVSVVSLSQYSREKIDEFDNTRGNLVDLSCVICDSQDFELIGQTDRYGFYYPTGICKECGNVQQTKYYDEDDLKIFYEHFLRDIYGEQTPQFLFPRQRARGLNILDFLTPFIPESCSVLEIGTGAGGILFEFLQTGRHTVLGLDFDKRFIEYGRSQGVALNVGGMETLPENKKFDLIILSHVLEHIVDPVDFLKTAMNFLSDKGIFYIEVPSLNSVLKGSYGCDLLRYYQNAHVVHYSEDTLAALLNRCGLSVNYMDYITRCVCQKNTDGAAYKAKTFSDMRECQERLLSSIERKRISPARFFRKNYMRSKVASLLESLGIKNWVKSIISKK